MKHKSRKILLSAKDVKKALYDKNLFPQQQFQFRRDFDKIGLEVGKLVKRKNKAYGDSFLKSEKFFELLYPNGIAPSQYGDALTLARVFDKMMRIATDKDAFGESPWQDILGYAILALAKKGK